MIHTTGKYILDERHNVVEETDLYKWAMWMEAGQHLPGGAGDSSAYGGIVI